ncbi:MAG: DUF2029 domain-containing protein [Chloroflexota bacterium]|nr:DUF2029 domain-containing protein [Chloroflexota bacterium]
MTSTGSVGRALLGASDASVMVRGARLVSVAILIAIGISHLFWALVQWPLHDMDVYLAAATRLRSGGVLYAPGGPSFFAYLYAPWFAAAWIPLSYLPRTVVAIGWSAILVLATAGVGWIVWRRGRSGPVLALLVTPPLLAVSAGGNVQALLVLGLLAGLNRRSGPIWVALAASLKLTPILLCAVYVRRRQWWRALSALALTAVLLLPALPMGLAGQLSFAARDTAAPSLMGACPPIYVLSVVAALVALVVLPDRFAPLSAALAALLALPRLFVYDVTLLAVGAVGAGSSRHRERPTSPASDAAGPHRFDEQSAST